jgi:hypothetical protein
MASIVAYIEVREGTITSPSLFVLCEARRIAHAVGATVYAFLPVGALSHVQIDQLAEQISAAGADRILCCSHETLRGPALDFTHGPVLTQLADHLRPLLFLFPAGGAGNQLGAPLAVRIGAAYVPFASIEIHTIDRPSDLPAHRLLVTRRRAAGDGMRRIDVGDLERPVVAVLQSGLPKDGLGEAYAEVEMLPCPNGKHGEVQVLAAEPDPAAHLETCATLVCIPAATSTDAFEALRAELPAGACLDTLANPDLSRASPESLLLVSDEPEPTIRARTVVRISGSPSDLVSALGLAQASKEGAAT